MSRPPKSAQQAKRVAPPAVPDIYRHSGSSFGSAGYGSCEESAAAAAFFLPTEAIRSNNCQTDTISTETVDYANTSVQQNSSLASNKTTNTNCTMSKSPATGACGVSGGVGAGANNAANINGSQGPFLFNANNPYQPLTHKAAVYYHQQLALQEDQGIDLTQSPGRDSPGSSSGSAGSGSRHSTASLDSGRASSYHTGASTSSTSTRISGGGGGTSLNNASVSSCSIGSVDRMCQRTDHEIICDWLRELCFEEYAPLFSAAGYDMPTISRMTPEDLTAIGIKKPRHRERIKQHIDALQLPDNLPHTVPVSTRSYRATTTLHVIVTAITLIFIICLITLAQGSIEEWLRLLRLDEYTQPLLAQGYQTVRDVTQLPWEDMEDIGIVKLGHQKKLLLAIKRIKDIMSGKWISPGITHSPQVSDLE